MTIVRSSAPVTGGVDTHLDVHVAAVRADTFSVTGLAHECPDTTRLSTDRSAVPSPKPPPDRLA